MSARERASTADPLVLGIDLATANARVVALSAGDGRVLAARHAPLPTPHRPIPGHSEQRPTHADVALELISAVVGDLGRRSADVVALSVTGTSGTVVPCDRSGRPVGSAWLYDDRRATAAAALLADAGAPAATTSSLVRMAGLVQSGVRAELFLSTADVVAAALAGRVLAADTSHHLKAGIDPLRRTWPEQWLSLLGIDPDGLPALVAPQSVIGEVTVAVADRLGLPTGVRIVAGMTDGCTAQLAAGAVTPGDTVGVLGTTLVFKAVADVAITDPATGVYSHFGPDGSWWPGGASNVGAGILAEDFAGADLVALDEAARRHGPATVLRYPLRGFGERFPIADPAMVGFSVGGRGAGIDGDRIDDYRGVLDGVAFTERLGLEVLARLGVPRGRHRLAGGATRSDVWNQIRADVLASPVLVPADPTSGRGAAILAAAAVRNDGLAAVVADLAPVVSEVEPDPAASRDLGERYLSWRAETTRARQPAH